jgi:hypothetical protein
LLEARVGRRHTETPLAIQGHARRRVLVVLPAVTWQATNQADSDGDGYPDTLNRQAEVPLQRPFAGGLPEGFARAEAPVLQFLDRERLRYDLTTDLALTARSAQPPIRYRGILFGAAPTFFSVPVGRLIRSYVGSGGRVAWLGTGSRYGAPGGFTRAVRVAPRRLVRGRGGPRFDDLASNENLFGERLVAGHPAGPLAVLSDRIGFFHGVGGSFGPFPGLEQSRRLPPAERLLAAAGLEAGRPSIVVYRYGKGVVARVGADDFAATAAGSPDVARIMRRLWILLSP